jgi:hypothetical protein
MPAPCPIRRDLHQVWQAFLNMALLFHVETKRAMNVIEDLGMRGA